MSCTVCSHCQGALGAEEDYACCEGYSYHKHCHKCYVCSETNLSNAEVFKGVIFCAGCSLRIFQACSITKRLRLRQIAKSPARIKRCRTKSRSKQVCGRRLIKNETRVIELARMARSAASEESNAGDHRKSSHHFKAHAHHRKLPLEQDIRSHMALNIETGPSKKVEEILLKDPSTYSLDDADELESLSNTNRHKQRYNPNLSDLRVAELGASTEIAHMALKKQSEECTKPKFKTNPVTLQTPVGNQQSESFSTEDDYGSDSSADEDDDEVVSNASHLSSEQRNLSIVRIMKTPLLYFKRNIIDRSPLITMLENNAGDSLHVLNRMKDYFRHDSITIRHRRAVKRLYSTINRRKQPYQMGWMPFKISSVILNASVYAELVPSLTRQRLLLQVKHELNSNVMVRHRPPRCKHFKSSASYRCMREQAMRLAGPTETELAELRAKIVKFFPAMMKILFKMNRRTPAVDSQDCSVPTQTGLHKVKSI